VYSTIRDSGISIFLHNLIRMILSSIDFARAEISPRASIPRSVYSLPSPSQTTTSLAPEYLCVICETWLLRSVMSVWLIQRASIQRIRRLARKRSILKAQKRLYRTNRTPPSMRIGAIASSVPQVYDSASKSPLWLMGR
jgi:hypothetical protein